MEIGCEEIVIARDALLERVLAFFKAQPDVLGVLLSGSLAAGTADVYADIDLRVAATEEGRARLLAGRLEWPGKWGELSFNEWVEGTDCCVSHFRPFLKLDVFYLSPRTFQPSPWLKLPTRILLDRIGLLREVCERSRQLGVPAPASTEVSRMLSKALATAHECVRRVRRDELVYAQALLGDLRKHMSQLDEYLHSPGYWLVSAGQREQRLSDGLKAALIQSYVGLDARAIDEAVRILGRMLGDQIQALHEMFELGRPLAADLEAVALVRDGRVAWCAHATR